MKERIVVERNEDTSEIVKKFPNRSGEHIDFIEIFTPYENCKLEQVPTTWEELKELCKGLKEYIIWNKNYCEIKNLKISKDGNIYYRQIQIYSDETITKNYITVVNNRTIPQLWAFIKSLIGEE